MQRLAQAANHRSDDHEQDHSSQIIGICDPQRAKLSRKEEIRSGGAQNCGQQSGPKATEIRGNHHRREECHVRDRVPQHRPEGPPDQQGDHRGQHRQAVGNQTGTRSLVHADLAVGSSEFVI